ncbi:peptidase M23 [Sulfitobacter sp.]|uniref:peptidase M23 n=1 Tax=Sulfitobacter sp. TaxID=1903071 RepID=UPI0030034AE8
MKTLFTAFPVVLSASLASAHDGAHMHYHISDPNWLPLLTGLFVIAGAAVIGWVQK